MLFYRSCSLLLLIAVCYGQEAHECGQEMCMIECSLGFEKDEFGCDICKCIPESEHECGAEMCMIECSQGFQKDQFGCNLCECVPEPEPEPEVFAAQTDPCEGVECDAGKTCKVFRLTATGHKIPKCIDPNLPEMCQPPMDSGSCKAMKPRWFYRDDTSVCEAFNYGGCEGNDNNFLTERACQLSCVQGLEPEEGECPDLDCAESCPDGHTKDETGCDTCDCIIDCGMLMCMMECPAGFKVDERGCNICECKPYCPDPNMCSINCIYGYEKDQNGCQMCKCSETEPCVEGLTCDEQCKYGFVISTKGCETCLCAPSPCKDKECGYEEVCEEKKVNGDWQAECISLHEQRPWCWNLPMCAMFCEFGFVSQPNGCPKCGCLQAPPKCTMQECTEPCDYGSMYDQSGCKTCTCLDNPCSVGKCDIACEVQPYENCPSCPASHKCLDEDSVKRIEVNMKYEYGEEQEFTQENILELKRLCREKLSKLIGIEEAYLQGLEVNSKPEDLSLAIEFHISSWGKHNLVQLYAQFKDKITTHAENTNLKFGETELIPEHESLMVAYSSDPHVAAGDGKDEDTEVDEDDMTVMVTIIAVVAGAFIALLVVAVVVFAIYRSKTKKPTAKNNPKVNYKKAPAGEQA